MKCSLLEKKITGDSARTEVFLYILVLYIYPRIVVIVSFHFEIKSRLVLLLFLNGGKVVVWLFFSSFPKNDVSPEKRESSVVFSFGLSFPERKKERKKEKKRPFNSKIFCPNGFFFRRPQNHSLFISHKKLSLLRGIIKFNTVVDKGERSAGDEDDEDEDEEKARDVFLEKRRRTPRGDTTPTRIRRRLVDSWERKRATTTTR